MNVGERMTMRDYAAVTRRRWWIVAALTLLAAVAGLVLSIVRTPMYESEAQILVQTRSTDSVFTTGLDLRGADATRAVQTEIQVLEGERVRSRLEENLGLDDPPSVAGAVVESTDVVSVRVRSPEPETAQRLADGYVEAYIDERREQSIEELTAAIEEVQNRISERESQIADLDADDPRRQLLLNQQAAFQQTLDQLQVDAALKTGGVRIVKSADLPAEPVEPRPVRTTVLGAVFGLLLGLAVAFVVDHFDDSVRSADELERLSSVPVLAVVPVDRPPDDRPVAISSPNDFAVEVYRGLRTNVQFLGVDRDMKVIQVTSALPGEGKTTTATNLATVLAQAGQRVAIVDADLRRPRVHQVFAAPATPGFVDLLVGAPLASVTHEVDAVGAPLTIVTCGDLSANPGELLSSERARQAIADLAVQFDYVIVDSAPVLPVADAIAMSAAADGVLFVAQAKRTSKRNVAEALERLGRVQAPVIGLVLNQATGASSHTYGYGYGYGGATERVVVQPMTATGDWPEPTAVGSVEPGA